MSRTMESGLACSDGLQGKLALTMAVSLLAVSAGLVMGLASADLVSLVIVSGIAVAGLCALYRLSLAMYLLLVGFLVTNEGIPLLAVPVGSFHLIDRDLLLGLALCSMLLAILRRRATFRMNPFLLPLFGLLLMYLVGIPLGLTWGSDPFRVFEGYRHANFLLGFLIVVASVTTRRQVRSLIEVFLGANVLSAIIALVLFAVFWGQGVQYRTSFGMAERYEDFLNMPRVMVNATPFFPMAALLSLSLGFTTDLPTNHRRRMLVYSALLVSGIVVSYSRALWLAFIAGLLAILCLVSLKRKIQLLGVIIMSIMVLSFFTANWLPGGNEFWEALGARLSSAIRLDEYDVSIWGRAFEIESILKEWSDSPVWGYGLGKTFLAYDVQTRSFVWAGFTHNSFMRILLSFGIVGFLIYVSILFRIGWLMFRMMTLTQNSYSAAVLRGLLASLVALVVGSIAIATLTQATGFFTLGFSAGLCGAIYQISSSTQEPCPCVSMPN